MKLTPRGICTAFVFLSLITHGSSRPAEGQQRAIAEFTGTVTAESSTPVGDRTANEIVSKMLAENQRRKDRLQSYTVVRKYEIRTQEGKVGAESVVRMEYRAPDVKMFEKTSEKGSGVVRRMVFDRLMDSESESASGQQRQESALTPANYDFRYTGEEDIGPYHCLVLQVVPKRKDKYLFEGKIWIESHDFAVVKIEGHPAKKLSFWINQADFVREYQKVDEFWLPLRDETLVEVRVYGKRVLTIEHGPYQITDKLESRAGQTD